MYGFALVLALFMFLAKVVDQPAHGTIAAPARGSLLVARRTLEGRHVVPYVDLRF